MFAICVHDILLIHILKNRKTFRILQETVFIITFVIKGRIPENCTQVTTKSKLNLT